MSISDINNFLLIVFILTILLGFYVLKANPKKHLNIAYAVFCAVIGSWILFNYLWGVFETSKTLLILTYIASSFILISMYSWVSFIFGDDLPPWIEYSIVFASFVSCCFGVASFIFENSLIVAVQSRLVFSTGMAFPYFTLYFLLLVIGFLIYFFYRFKSASKELKKSLTVMIAGIFLSILIGGTVSYVLPLIGFVNFAILDAPSAIFFITFSAYAILKMQMFDLKVVLTEILTYFVTILLFIMLFFVKEDLPIIFKIVFMVLFVYGGYYLVKSVKKEVEQREKLQELTTQLAQANAHLQDLDKMKTEFVSLASHELLTPVSAIEGYLSMVLDEKLVEVKDEKLAQYLDRVYRSAKRLARLIADMLNISRIEEGRLLIQKEDTEVGELVSQVIDEIKFKAEERKQKVEFVPTAKFPTYADPEKVKEVIVNLVGNSIKYSKNPGTITVSIEKVPTAKINQIWGKIEQEFKDRPLDDQESIKSAVDPKLREIIGSQQYLIQVKDQGIGIPKEELTKLFRKFHRVGDFSTAESQGTGLGLYISRALVELNHGRIWADSEGEGKGSTFSFSLPEFAAKQEIIDLEAQVPQSKEQLKPLAHTMTKDDSL